MAARLFRKLRKAYLMLGSAMFCSSAWRLAFSHGTYEHSFGVC
jgi:hypothetical protein